MKQFILKNIVLVAILVLTVIGSIVLLFLIEGKRRTIAHSLAEIEENVSKVAAIDSARKPNSVEQSEKMIKADTDALNKKNLEVYRNLGKPYRPALLKLIKNISSPVELKTDLSLDPDLVARPKPKAEREEGEEDEDTEAKNAEPSAPTKEELDVYDPSSKRIVLSFDEDTLHAMLAEIYRDVHQDSADEGDTFVIPDSIQSERAQLFEKLFNQIIEAPEVVGASRTEAYRKAAAAKFAQAFAIFREEIQELTLENVTYKVAHEIFLDALGLPRLMRPRDCKNYIDYLYEKYLSSDIIPGLPENDQIEKERRVQDFIYGKNLNRQARPVSEMVIPILRNFQIKEDLFSRMKDAGIGQLLSMTAGVFYGSTLDSDAEGPILSFTYTLEMTASMEAVDTFINSLHSAYKTGRVYVIKDIKFSAPFEDLIHANDIVAEHVEGASSVRRPATTIPGVPPTDPSLPPGAPPVTATATDPATQAAQQAAQQAAARPGYELTDPHHPDYGQTLIGGTQDEIKYTIVVNYLLYRADNITPQ